MTGLHRMDGAEITSDDILRARGVTPPSKFDRVEKATLAICALPVLAAMVVVVALIVSVLRGL